MAGKVLDFNINKKSGKIKQDCDRNGLNDSNVLDFVSKKKEQVEQKRRRFERFLFQNFLGAYCTIIKDEAVYQISLINISKDGCRFQVPQGVRSPHIEVGKEIMLRLYFTQSGYILIPVRILGEVEVVGDNDIQYRCRFSDTSGRDYEVLSLFVDFLQKFSEYSRVDQGDKKIYFA